MDGTARHGALAPDSSALVRRARGETLHKPSVAEVQGGRCQGKQVEVCEAVTRTNVLQMGECRHARGTSGRRKPRTRPLVNRGLGVRVPPSALVSVEVLKGRKRSALATRRATAGFPNRQARRGMDTRRVLDPGPAPARARNPGMGRSTHPLRRHQRDRDLLVTGDRAAGMTAYGRVVLVAAKVAPGHWHKGRTTVR